MKRFAVLKLENNDKTINKQIRRPRAYVANNLPKKTVF